MLNRRYTLTNILLTLVLLLITILCLYPMWYTFIVSFSNKSAVEAGYVRLLPIGINLTSYNMILRDLKFFRAFWVSVERVFLGGTINFFLTVLMAYPLSKSSAQFRWRNGYMWFILFTMLFSAGLIPWYLTIRYLGLINRIWALVLPGAVPVFNVILLMNFYRNIPKELEEAAHMDGANPWVTLFKIYLPLSLPALATVTLFSIVGHWNAYFDGLILMNSARMYPLQTFIQQLVVPRNFQDLTTDEIRVLAVVSQRTLNAAKIVVAMIPILCIYPFMQKYFVTGITLGSVKE